MSSKTSPGAEVTQGVCVEAAGARLAGWLHLPADPRGFVIFASSRDLMRIDRRQIDLCEALHERGLGTLLFDLVDASDSTEIEANIGILMGRLIGATGWSRKQRGASGLPLGYIGSDLGSAAALSAAAALVPRIRAVVSHSGRPGLAGERIAQVHSPALLVADAADPIAVDSAITAAAQLPGRYEVRWTRHSPSGRWQMTAEICDWMERHLGGP